MKRAVIASAVLLSTALTLGCHAPRLGARSSSCASGRCDTSQELVCTDGSCSVGDYSSRSAMSQKAAMAQAAMANAQAAEGAGAAANYQANGGMGGPLADMHNRQHVGPQSHLGPMPGPAMGPPAPTVTYPYYTTRGPRDYFLNNPPTIGR